MLELDPIEMVLVTGQVVTNEDTLRFVRLKFWSVLSDNLHDSCDDLLSSGWWSWGGRSWGQRRHTFGADGRGFGLVYRRHNLRDLYNLPGTRSNGLSNRASGQGGIDTIFIRCHRPLLRKLDLHLRSDNGLRRSCRS